MKQCHFVPRSPREGTTLQTVSLPTEAPSRFQGCCSSGGPVFPSSRWAGVRDSPPLRAPGLGDRGRCLEPQAWSQDGHLPHPPGQHPRKLTPRPWLPTLHNWGSRSRRGRQVRVQLGAQAVTLQWSTGKGGRGQLDTGRVPPLHRRPCFLKESAGARAGGAGEPSGLSTPTARLPTPTARLPHGQRAASGEGQVPGSAPRQPEGPRVSVPCFLISRGSCPPPTFSSRLRGTRRRRPPASY